MASLERLSPIQKRVKRDFYLSYLHSQGANQIQSGIFTFMGRFYANELGHTILRELPESPGWLAFSYTPRSHAKGESEFDSITPGATKRASFTDAHVFYRELALPVHRTRPKELTDRLAVMVVERDTEYQIRPRHMGADPHASFFRQYVTLGESTGSDVLDAMYTDMRGRIPKDMMEAHSKLATEWETNHPDQSFTPDVGPAQQVLNRLYSIVFRN